MESELRAAGEHRACAAEERRRLEDQVAALTQQQLSAQAQLHHAQVRPRAAGDNSMRLGLKGRRVSKE